MILASATNAVSEPLIIRAAWIRLSPRAMLLWKKAKLLQPRRCKEHRYRGLRDIVTETVLAGVCAVVLQRRAWGGSRN
jgi:hypothetical protein